MADQPPQDLALGAAALRLQNIDDDIVRYLFTHVKRVRGVDPVPDKLCEPMSDEEVRRYVVTNFASLWKHVPERLQRDRAEAETALKSLRESRPIPTPDTPHPDGPEPPHWMWWQGQRLMIGTPRSRRSWRLLEYFWDRDASTYEDLQGFEKPWLDPVHDEAVATAVNRFNSQMPSGFPWKLTTKDRHVVKKLLEIPAV